jgi:nucleoside 2-deoxyribosyltransferase
MVCEGGVVNEKTKEGVKFDQGKERYDLIPGYALNELAKIYTYGTQKYDDNNWRKGMKWGRLFGAMMRHAWKFWRGESIDSESGLHHLAHAAWQCFALMDYEKTHPELDDRFPDMKKNILEEQHFISPKKEKIRIYLAGTTTATEYRDTVHLYFDKYKCLEIIDPMQFETQKSVAVVKEDKDAIKTCDILVAFVQKPTFGTVMEILYAYDLRIPILVICNNEICKTDPWLEAHTHLYFKDINSCFEYILQDCIIYETNK